jgi:hypothetical protein
MKKARGIALISILFIAATLLAILGIGLKLGSNGVLFVSQAHKRNVALSAAEAGVYEAIIAIQVDKTFEGSATGTLTGSQGTYSYEVVNELFTSRVAHVTSTGEFGGVKRTLKVELEPDSAGFDGISISGKVYVFDQAYVNGLASPSNPIARPGNAHSEYLSGSSPSFEGQDFGEDGTTPLFHTSGDLTTRGSFHNALTRVSLSEQVGVSKPAYRLDPLEMASGTFNTVATIGPGVVSGNTEVTGDLTVTGKVVVPKGTKLVVHGRAEFLGGLSGEGEVVVDGDAIIRTDSTFDSSIEEGVKLSVGESVFISHPEAEIVNGAVSAEFDVVGDFFAQMPLQASNDLSIDIPTTAPQGGSFFTWFDSAASSPSAEFSLWYTGDGTDIHPGLSQETKQWLQQSRAIHSAITSWAAGATGS